MLKMNIQHIFRIWDKICSSLTNNGEEWELLNIMILGRFPRLKIIPHDFRRFSTNKNIFLNHKHVSQNSERFSVTLESFPWLYVIFHNYMNFHFSSKNLLQDRKL